jgi:L-cysteine desulfidase
MRLSDIGLLITKSINQLSNKKELLNAVDELKKKRVQQKNIELAKKTYYISKYEQKRDENEANYNVYLQEKNALFKKWKKNKKLSDLTNLVSLQFPEFNEVDDVYTSQIPINKTKLAHH